MYCKVSNFKIVSAYFVRCVVWLYFIADSIHLNYPTVASTRHILVGLAWGVEWRKKNFLKASHSECHSLGLVGFDYFSLILRRASRWSGVYSSCSLRCLRQWELLTAHSSFGHSTVSRWVVVLSWCSPVPGKCMEDPSEEVSHSSVSRSSKRSSTTWRQRLWQNVP